MQSKCITSPVPTRRLLHVERVRGLQVQDAKSPYKRSSVGRDGDCFLTNNYPLGTDNKLLAEQRATIPLVCDPLCSAGCFLVAHPTSPERAPVCG